MRRTLAASLLALLCSTAIYAQAVAGSGAVTGIVLDQYGDGIPEVTLVITNPSLGITRSIMTSDDGLFNAPGLVPSSTYTLKATKKGYEDWTLANFDVSVGENVNFRIPLVKAGSPPAGEPLSALAPVQDTKMSLSALVTFLQLQGLPSNARLVDKLVLLAPAVSENPSTGFLGFRGEQFMNSFLLDGINATNSYSVNKPGIAPLLAQDAIAEMQVISAAAPADFGHASGGIVNAVTRRTTGVRLHDYGCMLRAYRREIVDAMLLCKERSSFIPALANSFAKRIAEVPVGHAERAAGDSKYGFWKLINLQFDLLTSFSLLPLQMLSVLGVLISGLGIGFGIFLLCYRIFHPEGTVQGVFTLFAVLFFFVGAQFLAFGLLGEYIGRIYQEVRDRPRYVVKKHHGAGQD